MRNLFKKFTAIALSATMIVGTAGIITAAVSEGTDVSNGKGWTAYSIHSREDKGEWENALTKEGQKYRNEADAYKSYGEYAKISTQTSSNFLMDVTSTGWSANWTPSGTVAQSNPWGVTATKVANVERGRYYTMSFKIKSTLQNEIMKTEKQANGTGKNIGTGKYNYVKHIHFKAYDNTDKDGAALKLSGLKATIGGQNALVTGNKTINKDFSSFVTLNSKNTSDDGWVTVTATFKIPSLKSEYQKKASKPTVGIKFAFGAFLKEYPDENDMHGTIEVKDFAVKAGIQSPSQVKISKVTPKTKKAIVKFKKASKAKKYEVQYSLKKSFKGAKTKTTSKTKITLKKLKSKKKYYVRVRGYYTNNGKKIYGAYSAKKKVTIK